MTIYLDNAASSYPKPAEVIQAMHTMMLECTANPGRGGHQMAVRASRVLFDTRKQLAKLFQIKNPNDIFFAQNTTMALNQAIVGYLQQGDHVVCTSIEHNSVRRPLEFLRVQKQIEIDFLTHQLDGNVDPDELNKLIKRNTRLLIINHSSNLLGTILPIERLTEIAKANGIAVLLDAAQTAGVVPIDVNAIPIDMIAFPGHKGLYGPQGTGGLYVSPSLQLQPLITGGTGSKSEEVEQPNIRPDRYESGTQNTVGIAGLGEGVKFVLSQTVPAIFEKEHQQIQYLLENLAKLNGITILGPPLGEKRTGLVSFLLKDIDPSEIAFILDQNYSIAVRSGFHCTPLAHQTAGTILKGAVRASISFFTTKDELDALVDALSDISRHY